MKPPTPRQQLGVFLLALGLTRIVLRACESSRFWHGKRTGDGKLAEVAERKGYPVYGGHDHAQVSYDNGGFYAQGGCIMPGRSLDDKTGGYVTGLSLAVNNTGHPIRVQDREEFLRIVRGRWGQN